MPCTHPLCIEQGESTQSVEARRFLQDLIPQSPIFSGIFSPSLARASDLFQAFDAFPRILRNGKCKTVPNHTNFWHPYLSIIVPQKNSLSCRSSFWDLWNISQHNCALWANVTMLSSSVPHEERLSNTSSFSFGMSEMCVLGRCSGLYCMKKNFFSKKKTSRQIGRSSLFGKPSARTPVDNNTLVWILVELGVLVCCKGSLSDYRGIMLSSTLS